ncbi:histidine phosphatase family protein [Nakamurella silvestris]|nr:histidine phosphatase family protein [Nakamurella silvestris]
MTGTGEHRTLILLRHGKSAYPDGVADHGRPLAPRGDREAALAGRWIIDHAGPVDAVLCSTATRTRETLRAAGIQAPTTFADAVYDATPGELLAEVDRTDDTVSVLLVVGHVPGIPGLALTLANEFSDPATRSSVREHFPTSALAVLDVPGSWADLGSTGAALRSLVIPR